MGYAYDFSLNTYGFALGNSHEFMLRYTFGESKKDKRLENELKKLKDRQRRSTEELEDLLNDRLDEFKDEISAQQKEMFDAEKDAMKDELADAVNQAGGGTSQDNGNNGDNSMNNGNSNNSSFPATPAGGNNNGNGNIQGYNPNQYAGNVQAGSSGYYVTAGVFGSQNNAQKLKAKLSRQGISSDIFQDPNNSMYYVFLLKFGNYQSAKNAQESGLNGQYNGKLWIKVM